MSHNPRRSVYRDTVCAHSRPTLIITSDRVHMNDVCIYFFILVQKVLFPSTNLGIINEGTLAGTWETVCMSLIIYYKTQTHTHTHLVLLVLGSVQAAGIIVASHRNLLIQCRVRETFEPNQLKSTPSQLLPVFSGFNWLQNLLPLIWTGQ